MAAGIRARLSPSEGRRFGLTVGAAFLALAGLLWVRGRPGAGSVAGALGAALALAALLAPGRLGPVYRSWMGLAAALSKVTTPVFMGIVYFSVITPLALLRRAFGGNPLEHGRGRASCWVRRERTGGSDMERQF